MTLTTTTTTSGLAGDVRVGTYLRRSTDDEHQPYSIEAQDARLAAYIGSQPGWRQAARFTDDASGRHQHQARPAPRPRRRAGRGHRRAAGLPGGPAHPQPPRSRDAAR
jgi:Resolvase, N terminal domain